MRINYISNPTSNGITGHKEGGLPNLYGSTILVSDKYNLVGRGWAISLLVGQQQSYDERPVSRYFIPNEVWQEFNLNVALSSVLLVLTFRSSTQHCPSHFHEAFMGCGTSNATNVVEPKNQLNGGATGGGNSAPKLDSRLPFENYREAYTLKNYWKTVKRSDVECGKYMFAGWVTCAQPQLLQ